MITRNSCELPISQDCCTGKIQIANQVMDILRLLCGNCTVGQDWKYSIQGCGVQSKPKKSQSDLPLQVSIEDNLYKLSQSYFFAQATG
jgi:hypothetical protein